MSQYSSRKSRKDEIRSHDYYYEKEKRVHSKSSRKSRRRRSHSRSRSRSNSRLVSKKRYFDGSRSRSRSRSKRNRSRSRSYSRIRKPVYKSKSRSRSRPRYSRRSRSKSTEIRQTEKSSLKNTNRIRKSPARPTYRDPSPSKSIELPNDLDVKMYEVKSENIDLSENMEDGSQSYTDEPIDKAKIHKEMEEKLRLALAKEGKIYPPPKAEASHPVFANDGSFLEVFKKMQEQATKSQQKQTEEDNRSVTSTFGRRRGGKILKTGVVAKPKAQADGETTDPKDFWAIYLQEVNKYKNASCDSDSKTRPLVK